MKNYALLFSLFLLSVIGQAQSYEIWLNNRNFHSILKYSLEGEYLGEVISPGLGGISFPEDLQFLPDSSILVTGYQSSYIKHYSRSGSFIGNFNANHPVHNPSKMSIGPDSLLYVTHWSAQYPSVTRFDLSGNFVDTFINSALQGLGHQWDSLGNFYLSLWGQGDSGVICRYDINGALTDTFINSDFLNGPTDFWFQDNGDVLVEDWSKGTILRYNSNGTYQGIFASGLSNPEGYAIMDNGNILVGDWLVDAVFVVDSSGNNLGQIISSSTPGGPVLDDINGVYLVPSLSTGILNSAVHDWEYSVIQNESLFEIRWKMETNADVELKVMDVNGRVHVLLLDEYRSAGKHLLKWSKKNVSSPVIFFVLRIGDEQSTLKQITR